MPVDVTYTPVEDQDAFDAASVNSRFTGVGNSIDDLPTYALKDGAVGDPHINPGVTPVSGAGQDVYDLGAPRLHAVALYPGYQTLGWTVINDGTTNLQYDFGSDLTLLAQGSMGLTGILVLLNVHLERIQDTVDATVNTGQYIAFAIEWKDSGGTWHPMGRTERFVSQGSQTQYINMDIPIRTLITRADTTTNAIREIRAVASYVNTVDADTLGAWIRKGNLIGIPLYADYPT